MLDWGQIQEFGLGEGDGEHFVPAYNGGLGQGRSTRKLKDIHFSMGEIWLIVQDF